MTESTANPTNLEVVLTVIPPALSCNNRVCSRLQTVLRWIAVVGLLAGGEMVAQTTPVPAGSKAVQPDDAAVRSADVASPQQRKFVRNWTTKDLSRDLRRVGTGRSFERGKELFSAVNCAQCHRFNKVGGILGPDITGVSKRYSRAAMLREIIEPSKQITDKYLSHQITTTDGLVHQGLVARQDGKSLFLANDPAKPDQHLEIPLVTIEEKTPLSISVMPADLLDTLTKEEILDLLAYIESGGRADHPAFDPVGNE